ncbi:MAG: lycopene cyclase family protein [Flavisolibacter sp.]
MAGAGCAGLTLAMHMIRSGKFSDKKILLVDADPKRSNDRTWCFWEKEAGLFEEIVFRRWKKLRFYGMDYKTEFKTDPYEYKMIRGIDFYNFCFERIREHKNFTILCKKIDHVFSSHLTTGIMVEGHAIHSHYVFNSILFSRPELSVKQFWLLQHFKGFIIETPGHVFDPDSATLMDFRTQQQHGTTFCYVLPYSSTKAMVEYTLFSKDLLTEPEYRTGLDNYITEVLKIRDYTIKEEEFGVIPMTNFRFMQHQNNLVNIGTAGGQTKGSSGYTFYFIQKHSEALVKQLEKNGKPFINKSGGRFAFYDGVLLNILSNGPISGEEIFTLLFKKNPPVNILKFLDNESSLSEELRIISSLPTPPFLKAALWQLT